LNEEILREIPRLAGLYNAYANALDPESSEQADAAIAFTAELANPQTGKRPSRSATPELLQFQKSRAVFTDYAADFFAANR
jgi:hypothetical protein